ncbi:MAG TPA: LuxR family transcriptional regulator [Nocardioidaceae bacterium]|nr:LuxR family transcriptional regulator [Nocardioidaceae bacterium]
MGTSASYAHLTDTPVRDALVGRDSELDAIRRLLSSGGGDRNLRALLLEGEPGLGKTSLWEQGIAWGREHGMRVLTARANEAEAGLPFTALIDLLDEVGTEELTAVPTPQLRALTVALYRADPTDRPPEAAVISLGALSALRVLASHDRLLVAVDDLQWLDRTSEEALAYAIRRLQREPITFLLARRPGHRSPVERSFADDSLQTVRVGPLSIGATRQILADRLDLRLPHHLLRRVFDTTLGNPLFALEVGRTLVERDVESLGDDLPLPDDVEDLLGLRVADLDASAGEVLLALALDPDLRAAQMEDLTGPDGLERALEAGVVVRDDERIRASHPLLAAASKRRATAEERRNLHRGLAEVVTDEQRQALHLALATLTADEGLAALIAAAAERAAARGATRLAVDLGSHALRLTPTDSSAYHARVLALAEQLQCAGEKQRLTDLLSGAVESMPPGAVRVGAYLLLADGVVQGNDDIRRLFEEALVEAGDDQLLRARVLAHLAENEAVIEVRQVARADDRATESVERCPPGHPDDEKIAVYTAAWTRALRGEPIAHLAERYDALSADRAYVARNPGRVVGQRLVWRGEVRQARALLQSFQALTEERGEPRPYALARLHLCELELRVGGWDQAQRLLDEWAASTDSELLHWPMYERCRALLAAGRGDVTDARGWGGRALELAESTGVRWDWLEANRALGVTALLAKDVDEAVRHLEVVWQHTQREGVLDPGAFPVAPDLVEALVEAEAHDAARGVAVELNDLARIQDHPWGLAGAQRSLALVDLVGEGYSETSAQMLEESATSYRELGLAFDEARTLLLLGRAQRRAKKWGAAREVLERAIAAFEAIGSPGWADDCRSELARVGARKPSAEGGLTATELRVAELAVEGLSNKEIARTLVVTVNTVEFHLRNTYAKLGIRSRVQLAPRLASLDVAADADPRH